MKEGSNILRIFKETEIALGENDTYKLKLLSDQTNNTASQTQDPDNIAVAVIIYSLSKAIEREYLKEDKKKRIIELIERIISGLEKRDDKKIKDSLISLRKELEKASGKMKDYIQDVFRKARINKASKIYEHGISMEKTASLLGVTMFDLASYAGQKEEISETPESKTINARARIKMAMEMFG